MSTVSAAPELPTETKQLFYALQDKKLVVDERCRPLPKPSTRFPLLVQVKAAGINPVDAKGVLGDKLGHDSAVLRPLIDRNVTQGCCIGFEFAGVVLQSLSPDYQLGDEIYGSVPPYTGTLTEYLVAPLDQVAKAPSNLSWTERAVIPLVGLTCYQALSAENSTAKPLKSILVLGASGGTGHVACQVAKALGASTIVGVCSSRNRDFVVECGATQVVAYDTLEAEQTLESVIQSTHSESFDVILDCVTSADPRDFGQNYPKRFLEMASGRYIRLGGPTSDWVRAGIERLTPFKVFGKEKLFWIRFPKSSEELEQLKEWTEESKLSISVQKTVNFSKEDVQNAFDLIMQRRVRGKLVVQLSD